MSKFIRHDIEPTRPSLSAVTEALKPFMDGLVPVVRVARLPDANPSTNHRDHRHLIAMALHNSGYEIELPLVEPRKVVDAPDTGLHLDEAAGKDGIQVVRAQTSTRNAFCTFVASLHQGEYPEELLAELMQKGLYDPRYTGADFFAGEVKRGDTTLFGNFGPLRALHSITSLRQSRDCYYTDMSISMGTQDMQHQAVLLQ